jgi:hypothetical protein
MTPSRSFEMIASSAESTIAARYALARSSPLGRSTATVLVVGFRFLIRELGPGPAQEI